MKVLFFCAILFYIITSCTNSKSYHNVLVGDTWRCIGFHYDTSVFKTFQDRAKLDVVKLSYRGFYYKFFSDSSFKYGETSNEIDGKYFIDSASAAIVLNYDKPIKHLDLEKRFKDENSVFQSGDIETTSQNLNILGFNADTLIVGNNFLNYTFVRKSY